MKSLRLKAGPGPGNRLLAAGLPDHLIVSGKRRIWTNDSSLWDQLEDEIEVVDGSTLVGIAAVQGRAVIGWQSSGGLRISSSASAKAVDIPGARGIHLGVDWVVVDLGIERRILSVDGSDRPRIPVGAQDARPKAWSAGRGITWLDGGHVYQFEDGDRTRLHGKLSAPVEQWASGPHGAAIFLTPEGIFGLSGRDGLHLLPDIDVDTVRFSPDGREVVAVTAEGVVRWSLTEHRALGRIEGRLYPAGYTDGPVLLDEDVGTLRTWSGEVLATGFIPCAASVHKGRLYGPGGTAWSIETASRLWQDSPLAGAHLMATEGGVIQVDERIVGLDLDGSIAFNLPLSIDPDIDGPIYSTHWVDGMMYFEVEDGWIQIDFEGRRVGSNPPPLMNTEVPTLTTPWTFDDDSGVLANDDGPLPIIFDGAISNGDGAVLAWSEAGLLCLIRSA